MHWLELKEGSEEKKDIEEQKKLQKMRKDALRAESSAIIKRHYPHFQQAEIQPEEGELKDSEEGDAEYEELSALPEGLHPIIRNHGQPFDFTNKIVCPICIELQCKCSCCDNWEFSDKVQN